MASKSPSTWYLEPKGSVHDAVFQQVDYISRQQGTQRDNWIDFLEMYAAGDITGLGREYATSRYWSAAETEEGPEVRFNLACAAVDTAASLVSQQPSVPQYLTCDGDFKLQRQAEKASEVLQGQMSAEVREVLKRCWLDAAKVGTGVAFERLDPITGEAGVERVSVLEVFVEHLDGLHMRPRSMHRCRLVPRETLKAQFPKFSLAIDAAPGVERNRQNEHILAGMGDRTSFAYDDFVTVVESWHLRSSAKGKGRHTLCLATATMLDERYVHDEFPCSTFRYRERDFGFYGAGLIENCTPAQNRINALIRRVARGQDLASTLIIFNPNGENAVPKPQITNETALIINYDPLVGPPQLAKWEGTLGDLQNQIDLEFQRFLSTEGISVEQTNGQGAGKGLDSGVAVRAADDVQSRRLVPIVSRFQQSCMGVARLFERMNDDAASKDPSYAVSTTGSNERRRFLATSNWKEIRPPKGDARLNMAEMSALPTTPQGRWAAVNDWIQGGFTSRSYAMKLLQFPDLDSYASTELAHLDFARWQVTQILDGIMPDPDPRQDLQLCIDLMVKSKLKAATMKGTEEQLMLFEDFIVYAEELLNAAMAPAAPPPGAVPPPVPGMPGMPGAPVPPVPGLPIGPGAAAPLPTDVLAPGLGGMAG